MRLMTDYCATPGRVYQGGQGGSLRAASRSADMIASTLYPPRTRGGRKIRPRLRSTLDRPSCIMNSDGFMMQAQGMSPTIPQGCFARSGPSMSVHRKVTVPRGRSGSGHLLEGLGDSLLQRHHPSLGPRGCPTRGGPVAQIDASSPASSLPEAGA